MVVWILKVYRYMNFVFFHSPFSSITSRIRLFFVLPFLFPFSTSLSISLLLFQYPRPFFFSTSYSLCSPIYPVSWSNFLLSYSHLLFGSVLIVLLWGFWSETFTLGSITAQQINHYCKSVCLCVLVNMCMTCGNMYVACVDLHVKMCVYSIL